MIRGPQETPGLSACQDKTQAQEAAWATRMWQLLALPFCAVVGALASLAPKRSWPLGLAKNTVATKPSRISEMALRLHGSSILPTRCISWNWWGWNWCVRVAWSISRACVSLLAQGSLRVM